MKINTLIEILRLCKNPTTSTQIFRILEYSYDSIRDYTKYLIDNELMDIDNSMDKRTKTFKTTKKGLKFLSLYN